jgi:UMF1 family MFS transporter
MQPEDAASVEKGVEAAARPASKLEIFGWCMFDFANSSYTTIINTVVFPVYFMKTVAAGAFGADRAPLIWGVTIGVAQGLVLVSAPVVGAIADFSGAKKKSLRITYLGCVLATASLMAIGPGDIVFAIALFIVSNVFFSTGENLVAAFLPEIAPPEKMGRISGLGWALGYMGGLGSLLACLPFVRGGDPAGVRFSFLIAALFFLAGGIPTFLFLRERARPQALPAGTGYVATGFARTLDTLKRVRRYRQLFRFLAVFLCFGCGIAIIVYFASPYAEKELGMSPEDLIILFTVLQVSASAGALLFGFLQDRLSSKLTIQLTLVLWVIACAGAYTTRTEGAFYAVANVAGLALGSSQSAARALVGVFSPPGRTAEFFGFWGLYGKLSGLVGPTLFGLASAEYGMRKAILLTGLFFLLGIAGMAFIDEREGRRTATAGEPGVPEPVQARGTE